MTDRTDLREPTTVRRALLALEEMQARLDASEASRHEPIAIVGIGCRLPGKVTGPASFWRLLDAGDSGIVEVPIDRWDADAWYDADARTPGKMVSRSGGFLDDLAGFDPHFFGISARDAMGMDPQQRILLEVVWEAWEDAGIPPERVAGSRTGVWVGSTSNDYLFVQTRDPRGIDGMRAVNTAHSILAGRVSYLLDLHGPSLAIDSACSSSLSAVHLACRSLRSGETDRAIAAGVNAIITPLGSVCGSRMGILSARGRCRPFDAEADGFLRGEGCGVVILERLRDARAQGDPVWAVIQGSAVRQDGRSVGLTAPNGRAQSETIREALADARVEADHVGYVEAHGSATPLGDPVEIEALRDVMGGPRDGGSQVVVGAVKGSLGHLEGAAGITGLIKTALVLHHGAIPRNLEFESLNPNVPLEGSSLVLADRPRRWPRGRHPRVAGVSAFGFSGTNVHCVLVEAPDEPESGPAREHQLLVFSARTGAALEAVTDRLADHLSHCTERDLADVAHTLRTGRSRLPHRRALLCSGVEDAVAALSRRDPDRLMESVGEARERPVAFLFPGVGDHYPGMAAGLYASEPTFRRVLDEGCELLRPLIGVDLREYFEVAGAREGGPTAGGRGIDLRAMLGRETGPRSAARPPERALVAQPAVFVLEYALARLWMEWGVRPSAMIGHSIGEYVAACVAGVFSFEEGLRLVAARARLVDALAPGCMLAVSLSPERLRPWLEGSLALGAVNAPSMSVVSGEPHAIEALSLELAARRVTHRRLEVSHAFHSPMMRPAAEKLRDELEGVALRPPQIPYVANRTGTWVTAREAVDPASWARHLCETVRFADGIATLWADRATILLEVGPGQSLGSFALQQPETGPGPDRLAVASIRPRWVDEPDSAFLLRALGRLWLAGASFDPDGVVAHERRRRSRLPTYPFEHQRYWSRGDSASETAVAPPAGPDAATAQVRSWRRSPPAPVPAPTDPAHAAPWVVLLGASGCGEDLACRAEARGRAVVRVESGTSFSETEAGRRYRVDVTSPDALDALFKLLHARGRTPDTVLDLGAFGDGATAGGHGLERGVERVCALAEALGEWDDADLEVLIVTRGAHDVVGVDAQHPDRAVALGLCAAAGPGWRCVDLEAGRGPVDGGDDDSTDRDAADALLAETTRRGDASPVAYRRSRRWALEFGSPVPVPSGCVDAAGRFVAPPRSPGAPSSFHAVLGIEPAPLPVEAWPRAAGARGAVVLGDDLLDPGAPAPRRLANAVRRARELVAAADAAGLGCLLFATAASTPMDDASARLVGGGLDAFLGALARSRMGAPGARVVSLSWDRPPTRTVESSPDLLAGVLAAGPVRLQLRASAAAEEIESPGVAAAPASAHRRPQLMNAFVEPENELERRIAHIFEEVLAVQPVGTRDHFLDLGGNSLLASEVVSRLRETLDSDVPLRTLFESPTVAALARVVGPGPTPGGECVPSSP